MLTLMTGLAYKVILNTLYIKNPVRFKNRKSRLSPTTLKEKRYKKENCKDRKSRVQNIVNDMITGPICFTLLYTEYGYPTHTLSDEVIKWLHKFLALVIRYYNFFLSKQP